MLGRKMAYTSLILKSILKDIVLLFNVASPSAELFDCRNEWIWCFLMKGLHHNSRRLYRNYLMCFAEYLALNLLKNNVIYCCFLVGLLVFL
jgi:hypothetical protein